MIKKYRSKVSFTLVLVMTLVFLWPILLTAFTLGVSVKLVVIGFLLLLLYVFFLHMFFTTLYIIHDNKLKIKCGFLNYDEIDIRTIKEISKISNIVSAPAASFDRVEIKYGTFEEVIISPKNKMEFAQHIVSINPKITNKINEE